jgi:hypothetical protein
MVERFVLSNGTVSIANGSSTITGTSTTFNGRDLGAAEVWACPRAGVGTVGGVAATNALAFRIGLVAEVDPLRIYDNLSLPLVDPYYGPALVGVNYELRYGPAIANGATQAAVFERFLSFLQQSAGLIFNSADDVVTGLIPENSIYIDDVTRAIYQWRGGVLEVVSTIGAQWTPKGAYSGATTYALNDLVQSGNFIFISNAAGNLNHAPNTAPASTAYWTFVPLPTVQQVLDTLGIHQITVSTDFPSGGVNGDLWFRVA